MKAWKIGWAETANKHLALAVTISAWMGDYAEQGLDGIAQAISVRQKRPGRRAGRCTSHQPPGEAAKWPTALPMTGLLLKQLSRERSTFDEGNRQSTASLCR